MEGMYEEENNGSFDSAHVAKYIYADGNCG